MSLRRPGVSWWRHATSPSRRVLLLVLAAVVLVSAGLQLFNFLKDDGPLRIVPRRSVAVVGFDNLNGREESDWIATALAEMLGTEVGHGGALRILPGDQVARMKRELELGGVADLSAERLRQIHARLGSDFVVFGSFLSTGESLRVDLRLADAAVGKRLAAFDQTSSEGEISALVELLGDDVRGELGVGDDGEGDDPFSGLPRDRQAARLYSEALDYLRRSEAVAARDALVEAARIEAENPLVHSALSSAWQALGHGARAAEEAARAFELSSSLPREDRLVVEGRYRETQEDRGGTVEVYRQLVDLFPDNLEYGLHLIAAETAARRPDDALRTLERLRELPAPLSQDPRLDLAEASAAALVGDFEGQLAAARRGAEGARAVDADLLEAQGRLEASQALRILGRADEAVAAAEAAREIYTALDHPSGRALAEVALANAYFERSELDLAVERFETALEIHRSSGNQGGVAATLNNLALVRKKTGDLETAQELYEEATAVYEATDDRFGLANAFNNRAALLVLRDKLAAAREMFERSRAVWDEAEASHGQAFALSNLAAVRRLEGELALSRELENEALRLRREIGHTAGEVFSLINLGGVARELGELDEAEQRLKDGRRLAAEGGPRPALALALFELGELRRVEGLLDDSVTFHEEALALRQELDEKNMLAMSYAALARLRIERLESARAEVAARHAITDFNATGRAAEEARATALLARALVDLDLVPEARRMADDARRLGSASETFTIRFEVGLADARVAAAEQRIRTALAALVALEATVSAAGYPELVLEARLARATIENRAGRSGAADRLGELANEAALAGFGQISERARAALR